MLRKTQDDAWGHTHVNIYVYMCTHGPFTCHICSHMYTWGLLQTSLWGHPPWWQGYRSQLIQHRFECFLHAALSLAWFAHNFSEHSVLARHAFWDPSATKPIFGELWPIAVGVQSGRLPPLGLPVLGGDWAPMGVVSDLYLLPAQLLGVWQMGTSMWFTTRQGPSQNQTCFLGPGRLPCCQPRRVSTCHQLTSVLFLV